jgi:toxin ParE1/3/4
VTHRLVYRPRAAQDLDNIYDWIANWADPESAREIVGRIEKRCEGLALFPNRGTPHPEVCEGLRTVVTGKAVIAYIVDGPEVVILHVKYGGQELRGSNLG